MFFYFFFCSFRIEGEVHKVQSMCACSGVGRVYRVGAEDEFMKFVGDNATPYTNKIMKHVGA